MSNVRSNMHPFYLLPKDKKEAEDYLLSLLTELFINRHYTELEIHVNFDGEDLISGFEVFTSRHWDEEVEEDEGYDE